MLGHSGHSCPKQASLRLQAEVTCSDTCPSPSPHPSILRSGRYQNPDRQAFLVPAKLLLALEGALSRSRSTATQSAPRPQPPTVASHSPGGLGLREREAGLSTSATAQGHKLRGPVTWAYTTMRDTMAGSLGGGDTQGPPLLCRGNKTWLVAGGPCCSCRVTATVLAASESAQPLSR